MAELSSLFGWNQFATNVPLKIPTMDHLFSDAKQVKQEMIVAVDSSGSTLFRDKQAFDGKTFDQIYVEAIKNLHKLLPEHKIILWSSNAKELTALELE